MHGLVLFASLCVVGAKHPKHPRSHQLEHYFDELSGEDGKIDFEEINQHVHKAGKAHPAVDYSQMNNVIDWVTRDAQMSFDALDTDHDGLLTRAEFTCCPSQISPMTAELLLGHAAAYKRPYGAEPEATVHADEEPTDAAQYLTEEEWHQVRETFPPSPYERVDAPPAGSRAHDVDEL
jgi:hypothetical protein